MRAYLGARCSDAGLDVRMKIEPLVDEEKVDQVYGRLPIKKIRTTLVDPQTGRPVRTGRLGATVSIELKPPRKKFWGIGELGGFNREAVLSAVGAEIRPGSSATQAGNLLSSDQSWDEDVTFDRNGRQSTVSLASGRTPSMSFNIEAPGRGRPSDEEFQGGCGNVLDILDLGRQGLPLPLMIQGRRCGNVSMIGSALEAPIAQFVDPPAEAYVGRLHGSKRWMRVLLLAAALLVGLAAWRWASAPSDFDGLLTMQSILVGLVGAMSLHLWGEGLQARRDDRRYEGRVLRALDRMRSDLSGGARRGHDHRVDVGHRRPGSGRCSRGHCWDEHLRPPAVRRGRCEHGSALPRTALSLVGSAAVRRTAAQGRRRPPRRLSRNVRTASFGCRVNGWLRRLPDRRRHGCRRPPRGVAALPGPAGVGIADCAETRGSDRRHPARPGRGPHQAAGRRGPRRQPRGATVGVGGRSRGHHRRRPRHYR